jgi:Protein of unknown function (DUF3822)
MADKVSNILDKKYKQLVMQVSLQQFSYFVQDTLNQKIEIFETIDFDSVTNPSQVETFLSKIFEEKEEFKLDYDLVTLLHDNNLQTFVPQELFDEDYSGSYLQYNIKVYETDTFSNDTIENYNIKNVFIPYENINNFLIDHFGVFHYKHSYSVLVKNCLDLSKNIDKPLVYVHVQNQNFQVIAVKNQKLLLFNSFDFKTETDFIYYLLFTLEQLNFNPENIDIKLLGMITSNETLYNIMYKYIRNVSFVESKKILKVDFSELDYIKNFILLNSCE